MFDEFESGADDYASPDYDYDQDDRWPTAAPKFATRTSTTTTQRPTTTIAPFRALSADSLGEKKAAFMALDNDAKMAFLQRIISERAGGQAPGAMIDTSLTPSQKKEAFMKLPIDAKIAYLKEMARASGKTF